MNTKRDDTLEILLNEQYKRITRLEHLYLILLKDLDRRMVVSNKLIKSIKICTCVVIVSLFILGVLL